MLSGTLLWFRRPAGPATRAACGVGLAECRCRVDSVWASRGIT